MTLGQKLKEIRRRFGLSQEQLAEMLEVSRQSLTKWESDSALPDTKHLQEFANIFGVTIDYFLNSARQLPANISGKKFVYRQNRFVDCGRLKLG